MDRREFLRTSGGIAVAAAAGTAAPAAATAAEAGTTALAAPAIASNVRVLRLAMPWPDDGKGFGDSARRLALRIGQMSGQRIRIDVSQSDAPGASLVAGGEADLWHGAEHQHVKQHPAFAFFAGLPWEQSLEASELQSWIVAGGGQELWDDLAGEIGLKPLLAGHSGPGTLWSVRALETLTDLAGEKIHVSGLAADAVRALGAEPVQLNPQDIRGALASGGLTAAELGGAISSMSLGLPEVASRAYATPLTRSGTALALGVARRVWDQLPASDKALIEAAAAEELRVTVAEERAHREPIAIAMRQRCGVVYAEPGRELVGAMRRVGAAVVAHAAAFDARAQRINQSYLRFAKMSAVA